MKKTLTYLLGAATASSYWVAAIYGYNVNDKDLTGLWAIPIVLTIAALAFAVVETTYEK